MPIPDYQSIMLPLLKAISDGEVHLFKDVVNILTVKFNLSEEEQKQLLPSGQAFLFPNRVGWARTYLKKAGLIDTPKRGILVITPRGTAILEEKPKQIDNNLLKQFPEFVEFQHYKKQDTTTIEAVASSSSDEQTPEEIIENAYQKIRAALSIELLDTVRELSPFFFERLVVELLVKMGYGGSMKDAGEVIKKTGDEGIDGTIKEDKLGLDIIYIQAKRWQAGNMIGRPELQKFVGALAGQGAKKGIFITTSSFTREALNYIPRNETRIVLIDGEQLAELMIDHNLGVAPHRMYEIKRLDSDYFVEE
ncbi:restriction system protein [Anseongella ginsenosidimutans]|uniref:Restriction system protein n=1 Tax=Anseongella ginsenosidimutans TaxID=496056 RepID=A0A4R3KVG3_9SPHI|nr:restriction endonuclease [Anseongella ginsenosidimutans]QEC51719.1 restriction endonuclease [Anseongella ginsenosidimutans]TCS89081.1 restriction system protein [Anseongella ginsenosidimutans]